MTRVYVWQDRTNRTIGIFLTIQDAIDASDNHAETGDRIEECEIGHIDAFTTVATYHPWGWDTPNLSDSGDMPEWFDMPNFPTIRT